MSVKTRSLIFITFVSFWACQADVLLRIQHRNKKELKDAKDLVRNYTTVTWKQLKKSFDIQVPSSLKSDLIAKLNASVILEDTEKALEEAARQNELAKKKMQKKMQDSVFSIIDYFPFYDEIVKWIKSLASKASSFVAVKTIGKSYQGRPMYVIKIGFPLVKKKAVFITGGFHAREWLAVSTAVFTIHKLVAAIESGDERVWKILTKYNFYILPVANPDGYDYTFKGGKSRMWRKTRKPYGKCIGVDPNRNFDINFGGPGADHNACHSTYCGPTIFSENSTKNVEKFALSIKKELLMYIDIHSYSQFILHPYSYTHNQWPKNDQEIKRVALVMQKAIKTVNNRTYVVGTPHMLLGEDISGTCMDWMVKKLGIKYSFGFEVWPPKRAGHNGFTEIAPKDIYKTGNEIFAGILSGTETLR